MIKYVKNKKKEVFMKSQKTKQILLIVLIVTVLIAAFFNISHSIEVLKNVMAAGGNGVPAVKSSIGSTIGTICSWFNIALFVFIIFFYDYKKTNLLWILLPYLGSIIFGMMKLLEKDEDKK